MSALETRDVAALSALRSIGVKRRSIERQLSDGAEYIREIEFFPPGDGVLAAPISTGPTTTSTLQIETDPPCSCGHSLLSHNEAGCLHGCPIDGCGIGKEPSP